MNEVVKQIEKSTNYNFPFSEFKLERKGYGYYCISGNYLSNAVNNYKNKQEPIKVLKWFDDFWIYIEIHFVQINNEYKNLKKDKKDEYIKFLKQQYIKFEDDFYQASVTVSIFQGAESDEIKTQLFRAEWDNYGDNHLHPQPHWHIFPFKYDHKTTNDFEAFIELNREQGFQETIKSSTTKEIIDISKFHFAMCGQWTFDNGSTHIHSINKKTTLPMWLSGLLRHIKQQLEHSKKQRNANML